MLGRRRRSAAAHGKRLSVPMEDALSYYSFDFRLPASPILGEGEVYDPLVFKHHCSSGALD